MASDGQLPIYQNIKKLLRERIEKGELGPGDHVPSELSLSRDLKVSRSQTRQALRDLEMEGYVLRSQGKRSVVAPSSRWGGPRLAAQGRTVVVALPTANAGYYVQQLSEGFAHRASDYGFDTVFYYVDLNPEHELRFLADIRARGIAGLALWPVFRTQEVCELVADFYRLHFPCVLFDRFLPGVIADFVGTDNRDAYYHLTNEVLARGHRSIAYVTRDYGDTVQDDRLAGYRRALADAGLEFGVRRPKPLGYAGEDPLAPQIVRELLAQRPTAIISSDWLLVRFLQAQMEQNGMARGSMTFAAMDDNDPDTFKETPMVRVVQDGKLLGQLTAELLIERIKKPSKPTEQRLVPAKRLFETPGAPAASSVLEMTERN